MKWEKDLTMAEHKLSSGVRELIDQLRREGIAEGREEAEILLAKARKRAQDIVAKAESEAREIVGRAEAEAERFKVRATEAMQLATRDMVLDLKGTLTRQFSQRMNDVVAATLTDKDFVKRVIMEIARKAAGHEDSRETIEVLLPEKIIGLEELRQHPEKVKEGSLGQLMLSLSKEMLEQGVEIRGRESERPGIFIQLAKEEVRIDLSSEAVSELLAAHLLPRFRALLEGSIK